MPDAPPFEESPFEQPPLDESPADDAIPDAAVVDHVMLAGRGTGPDTAERLAALLTPEHRPEAEKLLIVSRLAGHDGGESRYLFVRWPDWPYPALLSIEPPRGDDSVEAAVTSLLDARLRVAVQGPVRVASVRVPVRMAQPRFGSAGVGWLRPAAVEVTGDPQADALLEGFEALTLEEALAALPTDVERRVLQEAAALFEAAP